MSKLLGNCANSIDFPKLIKQLEQVESPIITRGDEYCFGIKQIAEEELSNKFCISLKGESIKIEIYYFGVPSKSLRIAGVEKTDQITQVGVKMYYKNNEYKGIGESETEVRATMIQLSDE